MKSRRVAEGRWFHLSAAFCVLGTLLLAPAAEASRSLLAVLAPELAPLVAPARVLKEKPAEPQPSFQLFGDRNLPEHPLELVQIDKIASGVSICKPSLNIRQTRGLSRNCGGPSFQALLTGGTTAGDPLVRYPGQWKDDPAFVVTDPPQRNLFANGYRWYNPDWERYAQSDPVNPQLQALASSNVMVMPPNHYSYASANPVLT